MKKKIFQVEVIGFNADTFESNYDPYIINKVVDDYDTATYTLEAPVEVYDEINDLTENLIYII